MRARSAIGWQAEAPAPPAHNTFGDKVGQTLSSANPEAVPIAPRVSKGILAGALLLMLGCGHPPQLSTSLNIEKKSNELIFVTLKVANVENSVTTPLAIEVTGQAKTGGRWDKPTTLLHPAAFVLNRKEQREITKLWRIQADAVRTTLVIREQENGRLLKSEKAEKNW